MASHYEKQQMQINEFERINRQQAWEKRNPHLRELTMVEKIMKKTKEDKAKFQKKHAKRLEQQSVRMSFYNPNNPLNGSSSWSKEKWAEYKNSQGNK